MVNVSVQELTELAAMSHEQIEALDYETAMQKLEKVVCALEQEGTPLEVGLKLYAVGTALNKKCSGILDSAEEKMVQLLGSVVNPSEQPFNPEKDGK